MTRPQALVVLAGSDPQSALSQAETLLQTASADERPILLQAQGIAHRHLRNPEHSVARLRQSIDESNALSVDRVWSIRADLAVSLGELGSHGAGLVELAGLEDLDGAATSPGRERGNVPDLVVAKCWHAKGLLLQRMGRPVEAMDCYRRALPRYEEAQAHLRIGQINTNLALLNTYEGDVETALAHIDRADAAFTMAGDPWWQAVSLANRGWILGCSGHLPKALQLMSEADRLLAGMEMPDGLRVVSKAEVLLKGGLHGHARAELDRAIEHFDARHQTSDLSEALILAAQAAALDGDLPAALSLAERAVLELDHQNRPGWAAAARALRFGLQCRAGAAPSDLTSTVERLSAQLKEAGHDLAIPSVVLNAAWAHLDRGETKTARTRLRSVAADRLSTGDVVLRALAEARLAEMSGDTETALAALDTGFTRLEGDLGLLGGIDLAAQAAEAITRVVAEAKRILAGSSDSSRFLAWTDRGRQIATWRWPRLEDPELATLLNKARALGAAHEGSILDDDRAEALEDIKLRIQERRWQQPAPNPAIAVAAGSDRATNGPATLSTTSLIDFTRVGDEWMVTTRLPGASRDVEHRRTDVGAAQLGAAFRVVRLIQVAEPPIRPQLMAQLDQLLKPLDELIAGHLAEAPADLLLVGVDEALADLPWSALPSLWTQPFSLLPTHRYLGERPTRVSNRSGVSLIVGPGLASAGAEAALVPDGTGRALAPTPVGDFDDLAGALDNRVVHIAAHGGPEPENPLFNWLDFDCGRVFLHDLMFLDAVPDTVVLAACYAGLAHRFGAGGTASFANGFLGAGSRWVVAAGTALADDQALIDFAATVLNGIVDGALPPVALATARRGAADGRNSPAAIAFTCYGG